MTELRRAALNTMARQIDQQRVRRSSQVIGAQYGSGHDVVGGQEVISVDPASFIGTNTSGQIYGRVNEPLYVDRGVLNVRSDEDPFADQRAELLTVKTVGGSYTIGNTEDVVLVTAGNTTVTLPTAIGSRGRRVYVKAAYTAGPLNVAVNPRSGEFFEGTAGGTSLTFLSAATVVSDGTAGWWVI